MSMLGKLPIECKICGEKFLLTKYTTENEVHEHLGRYVLVMSYPLINRCETFYSSIGKILGCFLAWETRHVNVPALNDSKYIGMSVYNVVVMSTIGLAISVILQERVNEAFALSCFFIIFSTTLTLCLVFVPKIVELVRNPTGNNQKGYRRRMMKAGLNHGTTNATSVIQSAYESEKDILAKAEAENQLRRRCVHQKSTQLWDLLQKLRELGDTQFLQQDWCFASGLSSVAENNVLLLDKRTPVNGSSTTPTGNVAQQGRPWCDPEELSTML